jgi:hypothetical protein
MDIGEIAFHGRLQWQDDINVVQDAVEQVSSSRESELWPQPQRFPLKRS